MCLWFQGEAGVPGSRGAKGSSGMPVGLRLSLTFSSVSYWQFTITWKKGTIMCCVLVSLGWYGFTRAIWTIGSNWFQGNKDLTSMWMMLCQGMSLWNRWCCDGTTRGAGDQHRPSGLEPYSVIGACGSASVSIFYSPIKITSSKNMLQSDDHLRGANWSGGPSPLQPRRVESWVDMKEVWPALVWTHCLPIAFI